MNKLFQKSQDQLPLSTLRSRCAGAREPSSPDWLNACALALFKSWQGGFARSHDLMIRKRYFHAKCVVFLG